MSYDASKYARIVELEEFRRLREAEDMGVVVCTSGGFDPIHPGHVSCIVESKAHGDTLVVLVNDDEFLRKKKGKPFQDVETRCAVVAGIRGVDFVVPFRSPPGDSTVTVALRAVRPRYFTKGGDREVGRTVPESEERACRELSIEIVDGVGLDKRWSSRDFLAEWGEFWASRRDG